MTFKFFLRVLFLWLEKVRSSKTMNLRFEQLVDLEVPILWTVEFQLYLKITNKLKLTTQTTMKTSYLEAPIILNSSIQAHPNRTKIF